MFKNKIAKRRAKTKSKSKKSNFARFGFTPVYLVILLFVTAVALVVIISNIDSVDNNYPSINRTIRGLDRDDSFKKFTSVDEFKEYIEETEQNSYYSFGVSRNFAQADFAIDELSANVSLGTSKEAGFGGVGVADRVSDTNVQVMGIDESDIVKTDGSQIYFSDNTGGYSIEIPRRVFQTVGDIEDLVIDEEFFAPKNKNRTSIINAWPPSDLDISSEIDLAGDLLLVDDMLLVFSGKAIVAYDVSNPKEINKKWDMNLGDNTHLVTSRLYGDKVYLLTQTNINKYNPCPISLFTSDGEATIVPCGDIYHPNTLTQVDSTFTAISLDPVSGAFDDKISFVGNQNTANIYMSKEAMYVAYTQNIDMFDFMFVFMTTEMDDLIPSVVLTKLVKLDTYDISNNSKFNEMQATIDEWMQSLDKDESLKLQNEMQNRAENYYEKNKRLIITTSITKIDIDTLKIKASTSVAGYLLNQFSMDEFDGNLRVATTIGQSWGWGSSGRDSQTNDIYVFDRNLKEKGSILDLGLTERIYAVRFMGDLGYLVTFRQVDPFYVLDLSNPKKPEMVGELKIPGYSSYLHPIAKDRILGIGMEDRKVKISYFDVSNPNDPQDIAKYYLDEYGSETLYNHRAFLQDANHEVFFIPSYKGGYIFSYANDKIELVRTLNVPDVKRAVYLDDYMYIIAKDYIAVLNENDWEKVNDLDL